MRSELCGILIVLSFALGGCAMPRTTVEQSAVQIHPDYEDEFDFWDELAERRVVTNSDALYGLLLLADDEAATDSYESRLMSAWARDWVADGRNLSPNESATVGMIAVAVCDLLDIEGGVTMRLLGPSPRYCTRELVFLRLIPRRTENQSLTGLEFIDLVGRVEDRQVDRAAIELAGAGAGI